MTTSGKLETDPPSITSTDVEISSTNNNFKTTIAVSPTSTSGTTSGISRTPSYITSSTGGSSTYSTTQEQQETTVNYRDNNNNNLISTHNNNYNNRETTYPQPPSTTEEEIPIRTDFEEPPEIIRTLPPRVHTPAPERPFEPPRPLDPPYNPTGRPKHKGGRINSEAEERTAMIIGIVAGALIAVILVILLVLWIKSNGDRSYKTEHDKSGLYGQGPSAALLGSHTNTGTSHYGQSHHPSAPPYNQQPTYNTNSYTNGSTLPLNGSLRHHQNGGGGGAGSTGGLNYSGSEKSNTLQAGPVQKPKRNSKDIKEWYV